MRKVSVWIMVLVCLCLNLAAYADPTRYRGGVRNALDKHAFNIRQQEQVLQSLREKTGWLSLVFDAEGFLVCPDLLAVNGGSDAARRLLKAALFSAEAYDLEAHNHSSAVSFARLQAGVNFESRRTGDHITVYPVQLDFADFYQLRGDALALKAFDLGLVILHELGHGVWHLRDAADEAEEPGECETYINQIRRELQLPERQNYRAQVRAGTLNISMGTRKIAELQFARTVEKQGEPRRERFLLRWEAETVGGVAPLSPTPKAGVATALR